MHSFLQGRHALNIFEGAWVGGGGGGGGSFHTLWNEYLTHRFIKTHLHFERIHQKEVFSQRASEESRHFSNDSSERLWLVLAFLSSTESCVIGYN